MKYAELLNAQDRDRAALAKTRRIDARIAWGICFAFFLAIFLAGCTSTAPIAAAGPLDGKKTGTASTVRVLGMVVKGDGSTAAAARNCPTGPIHFVQTVDVRTTSVLGLYVRSTTIVVGE